MSLPIEKSSPTNPYFKYIERLKGEIKPIDKRVMESIPESPPKDLNLESTPDLSWRNVSVRQNAYNQNQNKETK